jgi:acetyltransferase-like isoleucine patch superfamily enzyme
VLFCPPVLLTTLTQAPELDLPYPLCRYIVPAGEAFPSALVEPWTRGRRQIINTYGPTEASTDTSRQSLRPGEPVTIGSPFPNVTYVVLEAGGLRPLPHGEEGELCIGGVHVARGYRNLPEMTAEKFITHPRFGRLYRTGDRCRIDIRTQRVHFLGRIDAQLKVRGHRVEAQAVEDVLQTQFGEIEAAVVDAQDDALVAFVVAPSIREGGAPAVAQAPAAWAAQVTATLARQLPASSVPTRIFLVDGFVLQPTSGKIDRRRLPRLPRPPGEAGPEAAGAGTESPAPSCEEALTICRAVFPGPLGPDDGFAQAGGDSITVARLAQRLQAAGWAVQVRDLLGDCDTARKVAARARAPRPAPEAPPPPARSDESRIAPEGDPVLSVGAFTALQVLFALILYAPALAAAFISLGLMDAGEFFATATLQGYLAVGALLYLAGLASPFAALGWVLALKRLLGKDLLGIREAPGVHRKWSRIHLKVWCIGRMERTVLQLLGTMYSSAPLLSYVLRRLGATVGRNVQCAQDASLSGPLGLISMGDDVSISTGAYVQATRWSGPHLHVGPVRLESRCRIGTRAGVAPGATVGAGAWVTPFTPILGDVGPGELWEGAPARLVGRCTGLERTANACRYAHPIWLLETANVLMQTFLSFWLTVVPTAAILWIARDFTFAGEAGLRSAYFQVTPLPEIAWGLAIYAFVTTWVTAVATSLLGCLFLRLTAASPGLYPSHGLRGALLLYRMKKMNRIQALWTWTVIGQYLRALAGVRFPRVGASECDVMINCVPELVSADSQAFWCNGAITSMLDPGGRALHASPARPAPKLLLRKQLRGGAREPPLQLPPGRLHPGERHPVPETDAVAARRARHRGG